MIVLREKEFSKFVFLKKLTDKLEKEKIEDFDISDKIQKDTTCITTNLDSLKIYIPEELEYSQYEIDDFIRSLNPRFRTSTDLDRDVYQMDIEGKLNENQYYKLVKFIIKNNEYCIIIDNKNL